MLYTKDKQDWAAISVYDLTDGTWQKLLVASYALTDEGSSYVQGIDANTSKGFVGLAAGDYDEDGVDEIAYYVPSNKDDGAFVGVYDVGLGTDHRIALSSLDSRFDVTSSNWGIGHNYLPAVHLATTSISGHDDLVINANNPFTDNVDQRAALGIYSMNEEGLSCVYSDNMLTSESGYRMRFCAAADADLLGNEEPVLAQATAGTWTAPSASALASRQRCRWVAPRT